ncbi:Serum paraoxonase/arylesterase 1 [Mortierella sp. 14UC]|nr:Serum paraoxonase/arylesterase 1 [Mortierella sp. 14UC]
MASGTTSKATSTKPTPSTTKPTMKSIAFGIAVAYGSSYLIGAIQFMQELVQDFGILQGEVASFNHEGCTPITFSSSSKQGQEKTVWLEACEDVHVHHGFGLAFAACAKDVESRKVWYPPAVKLNRDHPMLDDWLKDHLVVYDIENEVANAIELVGFPAEVDRVFHGLDIFEESSLTTNSNKGDEGKKLELTLFVINHRRSGSVVEVFEYTKDDRELGSLGSARYVETIENKLIRTPNDLLAMGRRSFYVTNDHYYKNGFGRHVEAFGRRSWSDVVYVSPEETFVAYKGIASANGIAANQNRTLVYVSAFHGGSLEILRPGNADSLPASLKRTVQDLNRLKFVESVKLRFTNDNVFHDTLTDSLLIAGHPKILKLAEGLEEPEGVPMQSPSKVFAGDQKLGPTAPIPESLVVLAIAVEGRGSAKGSVHRQDGAGG